MHPDRIILVYYEGTGLFDAVSGWSHKLLSPATYQCALCQVTFGLTGMLVPWKNYIEMLPFPVKFLHRDEFRAQFPAQATLAPPVILMEQDARTEILLTAEEIRAAGGLLGLIRRMQDRLDQRQRSTAAQRS